MFNKLKSQAGLSLIELIIYIGVIMPVMLVILRFSWAVMESGEKVEIGNELTQNGRMVMERFSQNVRQAEDIVTGSSVFDSHPGTLVLDMPGDTVTFSTFAETVTVGGQETSIRKLQMQTGAASPVELTSDRVNVSNFVVRNLTRSGYGKNVNLEVTLDYVELSDDPLYDESLQLETGITLREQ